MIFIEVPGKITVYNFTLEEDNKTLAEVPGIARGIFLKSNFEEKINFLRFVLDIFNMFMLL